MRPNVQSTPAEESIQSLTALGFTPIEASVYATLLADSPATGYAVARAIAKPVANTYKAIESLEAKGAIIVEDGQHRLCRAVPPGELLGRLQRSFVDRCARADQALSSLHHASSDDRVYQIRTRAQLAERCRRMLEACEQIAMIDAFPSPLAELAPDLAAAAARGVRVQILAYEPIDIPGAHITLAHETTPISLLYGQILTLVTDGREHARAMLAWKGDALLHGIWSGSLMLSCLEHDDLLCQIFTKAVERHIQQGDTMDDARASFDALRPVRIRHIPGYKELAARFGPAPVARDANQSISNAREAP